MNQVKKMKHFFIVLGIAVSLAGCSKNNKDAIDTEYPTIDVSAANAFPKQCSEFSRGQKYTVTIPVADNVALGSISIDVHHNFDHHSHSTEVGECVPEAVKAPVRPYLLVKTISIPEGSKSYTATTEIEIPADTDTGDYHFMVRVTDKEGWQTIKGLSIKIK